ncbi:hypothetical protein VPNG_08858 [Cytospora leucostoma]|uniref:D-xylose 1-dehydrogenase (NADP(+), D-xylono-1,5-lactone-forming) n=1 Tax=Cytospora leucostoma TaxID=1230097 RepID=A0A423VRR0_9PEZI|nr:hypothetical protein VPNG_08858 [Cytospora leucostoma]
MATLLGEIHRHWQEIDPPAVTKQDDALKFGILGAANIAPFFLINPARIHPEVIIHAVAARDKTRATAYAKKHGIPEVKDSYQAILDDPAIDVVYIPLPSWLHLEWALKALTKGKHVLLKKPCCSNAAEAESLFNSPLLKQPNAPVLMEAFHHRFAPVWSLFLETIDRPNVEHVLAKASIPSGLIKDDDIRFGYDRVAGATLDLGLYTIAALRGVFGTEPEECLEADLEERPPLPRERYDGKFQAKFRFSGGGIGEVEGGLRDSTKAPTSWTHSVVKVTHRAVVVTDEEVEEGEEAKKIRTVRFLNFRVTPPYYRVTTEDNFVVTKKGSTEVVKEYTKTKTTKAHTFKELGVDQPGQNYWLGYRYMLEQFVNRIRGREGTGVFISHEDSIAQMKALDMVYEKSGLGVRTTSQYELNASEVAPA